jgi:hypothetical protein
MGWSIVFRPAERRPAAYSILGDTYFVEVPAGWCLYRLDLAGQPIHERRFLTAAALLAYLRV